jgi:hypothetical protein
VISPGISASAMSCRKHRGQRAHTTMSGGAILYSAVRKIWDCARLRRVTFDIFGLTRRCPFLSADYGEHLKEPLARRHLAPRAATFVQQEVFQKELPLARAERPAARATRNLVVFGLRACLNLHELITSFAVRTSK